MKSFLKKIVLAPAICSLVAPNIAKADFDVPADTIHYIEQSNEIYMTGGTYNGKSGYKFETKTSCLNNVYDSNAMENTIRNSACINRIISTSGDNGVTIAPNSSDATVTIGSGTNATSINQSGVSVSGDYLIKHNSDGTIQLGSDTNDIDIST